MCNKIDIKSVYDIAQQRKRFKEMVQVQIIYFKRRSLKEIERTRKTSVTCPVRFMLERMRNVLNAK